MQDGGVRFLKLRAETAQATPARTSGRLPARPQAERGESDLCFLKPAGLFCPPLFSPPFPQRQPAKQAPSPSNVFFLKTQLLPNAKVIPAVTSVIL